MLDAAPIYSICSPSVFIVSYPYSLWTPSFISIHLFSNMFIKATINHEQILLISACSQLYHTFIETNYFIIIKTLLRCISWQYNNSSLIACNFTIINLSLIHLTSSNFSIHFKSIMVPTSPYPVLFANPNEFLLIIFSSYCPCWYPWLWDFLYAENICLSLIQCICKQSWLTT